MMDTDHLDLWKGKDKEPPNRFASIDSVISEIFDVLSATLDAVIELEPALDQSVTNAVKAVEDVVQSLGYPPGSRDSKYASRDPEDLMPRVAIPGLEAYIDSSMFLEKKNLERDLAALIARLKLAREDRRFTCFNDLPTRIRWKIWNYAVMDEAFNNFVVMDVYIRQIMPMRNLVSALMGTTKESRDRAEKVYKFSMGVYSVDKKSYNNIRRVLVNDREGPTTGGYYGLIWLCPGVQTFIYGPRYAQNKWVDGKTYCNFISSRYSVQNPPNPNHPLEPVPPQNLLGITGIAVPGMKAHGEVGRRLWPKEPEFDRGVKLFRRANEGTRLNVARAKTTAEVLAVLDEHGIAGLGRFCKTPDALQGPG
ncbi:hypothetical protein SLS62_010556 [Diatrype stigma]|uniref:2EXR domain-containing protein n=1 Tax=Diatrype stigma TaxID=117547 RepID=A0AAN9U9X9_9PEZI